MKNCVVRAEPEVHNELGAELNYRCFYLIDLYYSSFSIIISKKGSKDCSSSFEDKIFTEV